MTYARIFAVSVVFTAGIITILGSTNVNIVPTPTGGSRSDGIVELSFEHGAMQTPVIDNAKALETAKARCALWGYTDAEPFGGQERKCMDRDCYQYFVTWRYQCTGANEPKS